MTLESVTLLLLCVAAAVALAARALKIPYTVALVLAGLALGALHFLPAPHLTRELLYTLFLPGLIFEAAFHLRAEDLRQNQHLILTLAFPGVGLAVLLTTLLLTWTSGSALGTTYAWPTAFVFASLISATDPIAVIGLVKSLGAPRRLGVLIEGESLVNDGTAVVAFTLALRFVESGGVTLGGGAWDFARTVGAGVLVGAVVGLGVSKLIAWVDEPVLELTLTTIAAYGSFVAAERLEGSGILATLTAGLICGSLGSRGMCAQSQVAVESFWEFIAFVLNSLVFVLIGLEVRLAELVSHWRPVAIAFVVVMGTRAVVVYAALAAARWSPERVPWRWGAVLTWGGLRGALSMVLALSLPAQFPQRQLVVDMTLGVVLVSLLLNGLTTGPLLRRLGLGRSDVAALSNRGS